MRILQRKLHVAADREFVTMRHRLLHAAIARLPHGVQFELRRANFSRQIRRGSFVPDEPEIAEITRYARAGDWAIDVGANVGHYACHMARCVGPSGRVLAFEPVPVTFALLAANVRASGAANVTLFNVALSSSAAVLRMAVPPYEHTRVNNYYQAHISQAGEYPVLCLPLDAIPMPGPVRLVKIDAEGHDLQVLQGMEGLLRRDRPALIVEASRTGPVAAWLSERSYAIRKAVGPFNIVAEARERL
jgi:FkbM family methyltransferase